MDLLRVFPLSDWARNLTMRIFHRACRNAALAFWHFQLLTHHYIARHTLYFVVAWLHTNVQQLSYFLGESNLLRNSNTCLQLIFHWIYHKKVGKAKLYCVQFLMQRSEWYLFQERPEMTSSINWNILAICFCAKIGQF